MIWIIAYTVVGIVVAFGAAAAMAADKDEKYRKRVYVVLAFAVALIMWPAIALLFALSLIGDGIESAARWLAAKWKWL